MKQPISHEEAIANFSYDPKTGVILWKRKPNKRLPPGARAGTNCNGYLVVCVNGSNIYCHRLAWLIHYGRFPDGHLDHINGVKSDNRIHNLRQVSMATNQENMRKPRKHNRSGFLGVSIVGGNRYQARIGVNGKFINLGSFGTPEEASLAYISAKRVLHVGCTI